MSKNVQDRQHVAILACFDPACRSWEDVAQRAQVSVKQLMRWRRQPEYQAAYNEAREVLFGRAYDRLAGALVYAVDTQISLMGREYPPGVRRGAAGDVVETLFKFDERQMLLPRLENVEAALLAAQAGGVDDGRTGYKIVHDNDWRAGDAVDR